MPPGHCRAPTQRGPQVGMLGFQDSEPGLLVRPAQGPLGLMGLGEVVHSVTTADLVCLSAGFQLLQGVRTNRLQLAETDLCLGPRLEDDDAASPEGDAASSPHRAPGAGPVHLEEAGAARAPVSTTSNNWDSTRALSPSSKSGKDGGTGPRAPVPSSPRPSPHTALAAASVHRPANTASRRNRALFSSARRP